VRAAGGARLAALVHDVVDLLVRVVRLAVVSVVVAVRKGARVVAHEVVERLVRRRLGRVLLLLLRRLRLHSGRGRDGAAGTEDVCSTAGMARPSDCHSVRVCDGRCKSSRAHVVMANAAAVCVQLRDEAAPHCLLAAWV
jgi:hypothetical protein